MNEWISIKDHLPIEFQQVLCCSSKNEIFTAYYSRYEVNYHPFYIDKWDSNHCCGREPINTVYWMPLPELPKE